MMKKLTKAALLAAATAFLLAGVTACFTSVNADDVSPPEPMVYDLSDLKVSVTKIESADTRIVEVKTKEETARAATVSEGNIIKLVTIMPKSPGSTYFIITTDAEVETWYLPVTVTKDLEVRIDPEDLTDEKPAGDEPFTSWAAKLADVSAAVSPYKSSDTPAKLNIGNDPITADTAVVIYSKSGQLRVRDDGTLNYNGGTTDAFATTAVGGTLLEKLDRYVGVDTGRLASSGNIKVTITVKAVASEKATGDSGQVVLVDGNDKILAYHDKVKLKSGEDTFDISATVAAGTMVYVGFSRGGAGAGGIDVTAIKAETDDGSGTPAAPAEPSDPAEPSVPTDPSNPDDPDDNESEEPGDSEEETPVIGEKLSVDFTTFEATTVCEAGSITPVQLGDTDFFAVSGTDGKAIELKEQNKAMALTFNGTGVMDKNAVFFYAKKGSATVTVKYYQGSAGRYVKVLNDGMDTTEATDNEKTTTDKAVKTRVITITIDNDSTPVYIGSANSGIYVASIDVVYN